MTWPEVERKGAAYSGTERQLLDGWLDWHRATLLSKCAGLDGAQLAERSVPPSGLSLLGLVRHLAEVERGWFREEWRDDVGPMYDDSGDPDADFNETDPARADDDLAAFLAEVEAARAEAARHELDDVTPVRRRGEVREISLRWIYLHMIEEYARHNGHADLLRERIDGVTGE